MYKEVIRFQMAIETQKQFTRILTSLFRVQQSVADLFFNQRLEKMIEQLLESYQQQKQGHIQILKNTVALLEEILYLKQCDIVPLAIAQEQLLRYTLGALKEKRAQAKKVVAPALDISPPMIADPKIEDLKERLPDTKLTQLKEINPIASRQKILEFVRRVPERRSKEIIHEFSAFSERTVKRGLKELSAGGQIVKKIENGTVYYSAV